MIEPTETESKETLDAFADAMLKIAAEAETDPHPLHQAPVTTPVGAWTRPGRPVPWSPAGTRRPSPTRPPPTRPTRARPTSQPRSRPGWNAPVPVRG